jgi:type IV pilus assembly protein PilW
MVVKQKKSGFTMVELLVVLAVSSIVFTLMYQVYRLQLKSHTTQQELVEMQQSMRAALYLMEREIRMAGYAPTGEIPLAPITTATSNEIRFSMDLTMDGDTDATGEKITYKRSGDSDSLWRIDHNGTGADAVLDADDIEGLVFRYKGADGQTLDTAIPDNLEKIRTVEIILTGRIGTTIMVDRHDMVLSSEVKVRNLGLNPLAGDDEGTGP